MSPVKKVKLTKSSRLAILKMELRVIPKSILLVEGLPDPARGIAASQP
jgi:hypothetical protein